MWQETETAIKNTEKAAAEAKIATETTNTQIQQMKVGAIEQMLRIAGQKAGLNKTATEINKMANEIANAKDITAINTSSAEWTGQWTRIGTDIIRAITGATK